MNIFAALLIVLGLNGPSFLFANEVNLPNLCEVERLYFKIIDFSGTYNVNFNFPDISQMGCRFEIGRFNASDLSEPVEIVVTNEQGAVTARATNRRLDMYWDSNVIDIGWSGYGSELLWNFYYSKDLRSGEEFISLFDIRGRLMATEPMIEYRRRVN